MRISDWSSTCALPIYPDARGDQPLAHRLAMIARRDPAADAFGEAAEDDALHPDRQQAELFAAQPRDGTHRAFPPLDPAADPAQPRVARLMPIAIVDRLETFDVDKQQRRRKIVGARAHAKARQSARYGKRGAGRDDLGGRRN